MLFHLECSRRKVRCDRKLPCANCVRMEATCVFPKFRRRPIRHRKALKERSQANIPASPSTSSGHYAARSIHDVDTTISEQEPSASSQAALDTEAEETPWLVSERNRSRYVGNVFWTNMSTQVTPHATYTMTFRDRKSTRLNSSHSGESRMPSSA